MSEIARTLAICAGLGTALAFFILGAFASAGRARSILGKRAGRFESLDSETLSSSVRATYWGPPGIAFVILVSALYGRIAQLAPAFRGRIWIGFLVAAVIGIAISQVQRILIRAWVERYLERRLTP